MRPETALPEFPPLMLFGQQHHYEKRLV